MLAHLEWLIIVTPLLLFPNKEDDISLSSSLSSEVSPSVGSSN